MRPILLDTHVALFAIAGNLASATTCAIDAAAKNNELLLSPITAWEIAMLARKGRLTLDEDVTRYVRRLFAASGVTVATLSPAIAVASTLLPGTFHDDPADRILVATAAEYGADFATRDRAIQAYARETKHIRCLNAT